MSETHYEVLNINQDSKFQEIKKAYRRLSMQWHPDKNPDNSKEAEEKIKKINKAYEILSDENNRIEYDEKINSQNRQNGHHGNLINDNNLEMFKNLFSHLQEAYENISEGNVDDEDEDNINQKNRPGLTSKLFGLMKKPIPIIKSISISMEDSYHGLSYPLLIKRWILINNVKQFEEETIYVNIPEGIDDNEIIIFREKGNIINEKLKGDVKIFIKIINEPPFIFTRKGLDIYYNKTISLKEALCGFSFTLNHINGNSYQINNKDTIITPNYTKTVTKLGMKRETYIGNLIINFTIIFPEQLTLNMKEELNKIL